MPLALPTGVACPSMPMHNGGHSGTEVVIKDDFYDPSDLSITRGQTVPLDPSW